MGHREPLKAGDEYDAVSRHWKAVLHWKAGERREIKRRLRRRARRAGKVEAQEYFAGSVILR